MCAAAAFGSIYLYTTELSPTNHRGKMLGICDFSARIGQCLHNPLISYNMVLFRARYQHVMIKADMMYPPPGSFAGPYASLLFAWNKTFTLALFSVLALVGACFNLRLPETKGIPTPNSAEEVALSIAAVILQARKRLTFSPGLCSIFLSFQVQRRSGRKVTMTEYVGENPVASNSV